MQKKFKEFQGQQIGLKPKLNMKGPNDSKSKIKKYKNNLSLVVESCWPEGPPDFSNCTKKKFKNGKAD